jgi:hypothetical protein
VATGRYAHDELRARRAIVLVCRGAGLPRVVRRLATLRRKRGPRVSRDELVRAVRALEAEPLPANASPPSVHDFRPMDLYSMRLRLQDLECQVCHAEMRGRFRPVSEVHGC